MHKRKVVAFVLAACVYLCICFLPVSFDIGGIANADAVLIESGFEGGDGSVAAPFLISSAAHLDNVRNYLYNADVYEGSDETLQGYHFRLTADIDLADYLAEGGEGYAKWGEEGWLPIADECLSGVYTGEPVFRFLGVFDGGGFTISGLQSNRDMAALFGGANAYFHDLRIELGEKGIVGNKNAAGLVVEIVGENNAPAKIEKCSVKGGISLKESAFFSENTCGGLAGYADRTIISQSYFEGTINDVIPSAEYNALGGLAGEAIESEFLNCYANVKFELNEEMPSDCAGGLIGLGASSIKITNCYAFAEAEYPIGTIIGNMGTMPWQSKLLLAVYNVYYNDDITANGYVVNEHFAALTIGKMRSVANFSGWDFEEIWDINEGVSAPELRCFLAEPYQKPTVPMPSDPADNPKKLSAGEIAGTAIGGVFTLSLIIFAVIWFGVKKRSFRDIAAVVKKPFVRVETVEKTVIEKETVYVEKEPERVPFPDTLTEREREVAVAMLSGKERAQLCRELFISEGTLKKHIEHIYEKTGCTSRAEFISRYHGNKKDS